MGILQAEVHEIPLGGHLTERTPQCSAAGVSKHLNDCGRKGRVFGMPLQDSIWYAAHKDQTREAGSGESASSTAAKAVPQDCITVFPQQAEPDSSLGDILQMSLRTNLLGLFATCRGLSEGRRKAAWGSVCPPRVPLNAFRKLAAFPELPRQVCLLSCFPVHAQRLFCVWKGHALALTKNHLTLPCLGVWWRWRTPFLVLQVGDFEAGVF